MRTTMTGTGYLEAPDRVLEALEQELIDASDEEVLEAAKELGMNPEMKGSAVFAGLKYPARPKLSDFFDVDTLRKEMLERHVGKRLEGPKRKAGEKHRPDND